MKVSARNPAIHNTATSAAWKSVQGDLWKLVRRCCLQTNNGCKGADEVDLRCRAAGKPRLAGGSARHGASGCRGPLPGSRLTLLRFCPCPCPAAVPLPPRSHRALCSAERPDAMGRPGCPRRSPCANLHIRHWICRFANMFNRRISRYLYVFRAIT